MQSLEVSSAESVNPEDNRSLRDLSLGVSYEALSDLDASERVCYFSEGRRLLFGV